MAFFFIGIATPRSARVAYFLHRAPHALRGADALCLCVLTAALLVLLSGTAGAGIVSAGSLFLDNGLGALVVLGDLGSLFLGQDGVPLGQGEQVVRAGDQHVVVQLFQIDIQGNFGGFIEIVQLLFFPKAGVDAIQKTHEDHGIGFVLVHQLLEGTGHLFVGPVQNIAVDLLFRGTVFLPEVGKAFIGLIGDQIFPILK